MDQMVWLGNTWRSSLFFPAHSIQEARLERYVGNKLMLVDDIQITHDLASPPPGQKEHQQQSQHEKQNKKDNLKNH